MDMHPVSHTGKESLVTLDTSSCLGGKCNYDMSHAKQKKTS